MTGNLSRRGTLLVVVMGLISLMLALTIGVASQVSEATREVGMIQREAQCYVMMTNAKILATRLYQKSQWRDSINQPFTLLSPIANPQYITIGDQPSLIPNHPAASSLGWARIDFGGTLTDPVGTPYGTPAVPPVPPTATDDRVPWPVRVIASGGSSGAGGVKSAVGAKSSTAQNKSRAQQMAYERRRFYSMVIHGRVQGTCYTGGSARTPETSPFLGWTTVTPVNPLTDYDSLFP